MIGGVFVPSKCESGGEIFPRYFKKKTQTSQLVAVSQVCSFPLTILTSHLVSASQQTRKQHLINK